MAAVTSPLDPVAENAGPYPVEILDCAQTGLCLFGAAFRGVNDAIHMVNAGLYIDVVDTDENRLRDMQALYPDGCVFHHMDAWTFAGYAKGNGKRWDVVSVDPFTGGTGQRAIDDIELWCSLADKFVTITVSRRMTMPRTPDGWKRMSVMRRSHNAGWLVLERG